MKVDMWKSDTLKAIAAQQVAKETSNRMAETVAREAMKVIHFLLPRKGVELNALEDSLLQDVIKPAVELTEMMCVSTRTYKMKYPKTPKASTMDELTSKWNLKDIEGWSKFRQCESGLGLEIVRRLHPALVLHSSSDGRKVLVKPVLGIRKVAGSGSRPQQTLIRKEPMETESPV